MNCKIDFTVHSMQQSTFTKFENQFEKLFLWNKMESNAIYN